MTYQLTHGNTIKRLSDNVFIPQDSANTDYQQYLVWLEEGNTPLPPDPIAEPEPLTAQQKLEAAGLSIEELKELLGL
jgi:hypothetical protein